MTKQARHVAIKHIILHETVGTQEELCRALRKAGHIVTQATLSRDLKELGVGRVNTPEGVHYVLHAEIEERKLKSFVGYEIEDIDHNEALIVIRTLPGRAQGVAEIIDGLHHPSILGTLAGDNTIFVTPTSARKILGVIKALKSLMSEEKKVA
jgi:transcriptional regulator of arginine metabolism